MVVNSCMCFNAGVAGGSIVSRGAIEVDALGSNSARDFF